MEQRVKVLTHSQDIEAKINQCLKDMNNNGWKLTQIISHFANRSTWTLLFEKESEVNANANECR